MYALNKISTLLRDARDQYEYVVGVFALLHPKEKYRCHANTMIMPSSFRCTAATYNSNDVNIVEKHIDNLAHIVGCTSIGVVIFSYLCKRNVRYPGMEIALDLIRA